MKSDKAAGVDGIPPELWKSGGPVLHSKLHELFFCCWEQGKLPRDLRDAVIATLYKNKGEKSDCYNNRGITLLSITGKIFTRVLLNRLVPIIAEANSQKPSVASEQTGKPQTWFSSSGRSKKSVESRTKDCM